MAQGSQRKKPLYRKVNTKTHGVRHLFGGDFKARRPSHTIDHRNHADVPLAMHEGMSQGIQRGLDYTPLFKFLLSKVGQPWQAVHSEAVARLDKPEPIFWLVDTDLDAENLDSADGMVRLGENSYYSRLYVNADGILCKVNPALNEDSMKPFCHCCSHTFNGIVFSQTFDDPLV